MKRNVIKRIIRQLRDTEGAMMEIDLALCEAIEENNELCTVQMSANLSKLADCLEYILDDDHGWSSNALCKEEHPGKGVWRDPIGNQSYVPICNCEDCNRD